MRPPVLPQAIRKHLAHAKWHRDLDAVEVVRAYELGWLLTDFATGVLPYTETSLYETLHELTGIVVKARIGVDNAWYEDIVQDTVTYVMYDRNIIERGVYQPWRHLLSTIIRKPIERLITLEEEKLQHLAMFGEVTLGELSERGGLRMSAKRISSLLSSGQLLLLPAELEGQDPYLKRYVENVIEDVTVRRPRYSDMIKAYRALSQRAGTLVLEEIEQHVSAS